MALPKPVWSNDVIRNWSSLTWNTWNNDPTTLAVLRAIASCHDRLDDGTYFGADITHTLAQQYVCLFSLLLIEREGSVLLIPFQAPFNFGSTPLSSRFWEDTS